MLQQQHPSPARLGLTTTTNQPNSPSIPPPPSSSSSFNTSTPPNPKPPPLPSITSTTNTTTTTATITTITATTPATTATTTTTTANRLSPSLLPLLPPLPRAQSLLLQLSSLSSRLFDSSSKQPPCFLPPPTPIPPYPLLPNPPSSSSPSSIHSQLLSSVQDLQSILQSRDSLSSVSRRISTVDSSLLSFARKMNDARHILDDLLDDYSHYRVPTKRRKTDSSSSSSSSTSSFSPLAIPLDDLLSYAHRISYTTFAPPEFGAGQGPLRGALPPAPQEEQMRASQLYNAAATLDLGLSKVEGAGDGVAAGKLLLENLIEPTPPREELAQQPPGVPPIAVPEGWRKGMPIDLPKDLPPLPPGWKPGDPIQLPPMLEASIGGGNLEEQPRLPVAAGGIAAGGAPPVVQPRQPEPIQVKYVQLDINPEDDYSSDYSSDASSDEDDED